MSCKPAQLPGADAGTFVGHQNQSMNHQVGVHDGGGSPASSGKKMLP